MKDKLVSVIVPVYNVEKYINRCIESILFQSYSNIEIILIDDGSTDNSGNICDLYKKKDKRIIVIHKKNGGLSDARNCGLKKMSGDYVMFVDSDDYIDANMISFLMNDMLINDSDISICSYYYINEHKKEKPTFKQNKFVSKKPDLFYNLYNEYSGITVSSCMKLYKSSIFKNLKFTKGVIHEDEIIVLDILKKINKISYNLEPLYYYELREGSITRKFDIRKLDVLPYMDKRIEYFKQIKCNQLVQMTEYKKLNIQMVLLQDYYRYNSENSNFTNIKMLKKEIKKVSKRCIIYKSLSKKSRINSLCAYIFPLEFYMKIKNKWR